MIFLWIGLSLICIFILYLLALMGRSSHPDWKKLEGFRYAHRGLHGKGIPENSMAAFYLAVRHGYGIELDVHLIKDGNLAVIHDASLLRTAGVDVNVEDLTLEQLSGFRLEGTEETIPSFLQVLDAVAEAIKADEDLQIYTSGTNNIFRYPELADHTRASELINTFEEKQQLSGLVQEALSSESSETGIQVYIGNETPVQSMKDCSVVTATYELGDGLKGTIGIIGPKRMDYDKVVGTLRNLQSQLDELYHADRDKKN